jgi:hypothetical protein
MTRAEVRSAVIKAFPKADAVSVVPMDAGHSTGIAVSFTRSGITYRSGVIVRKGGMSVRDAIEHLQAWAAKVPVND